MLINHPRTGVEEASWNSDESRCGNAQTVINDLMINQPSSLEFIRQAVTNSPSSNEQTFHSFSAFYLKSIMAEPFSDFYLDITPITNYFNDLATQCTPDWQSFSNQPLSGTLDVFSTNLIVAITATYHAIEAWITLLFHLCRLLLHIIFLSFPYIKPIIVGTYKYWNSLDLTIQLTILGLVLATALSYWIRKNRFIARAHLYFQHHLDRLKSWSKARWRSLIHWISVRSQMAAQIFPHFVWWMLLPLFLWFAADHVYAAHSVWSFIGCFVFPAIRTYSNIRKYAMITPPESDESQDSPQFMNEKEKSLVF